MKRIVLSIALTIAAFAAAAQDIYSSIEFSQNHYTGTARTMAMGNAVTAVGGDLGAINVNPAASAVFHYGQFTVSPGYSRSNASGSFAPTYNASRGLTDSDYTSTRSKSNGKFRLPNIGASMYIGTGKTSGLTGFSFAVVSNATGNYLDAVQASGVNNETSISGAFAAAAYGIPESELLAEDAVSYYNLNTLTAYRAYVINPLPPYVDEYYGAAEYYDGSSIYTAGPLNQLSSQVMAGSKNDLEFNMGFNFSDRWMLGFSLGTPTLSYLYTESFVESTQNYADFPLDGSYLDFLTYQYQMTRDVSGIYAKVGAIWLPTDNLRLGAAFRTPTSYHVSESYDVYQSRDLVDKSYKEDQQFGEYSYRLRSPYTFNLGVAYTFGSRALLSVDYEMADFSTMKYRGSDRQFEARNIENQLFCGQQQMFRIGGEYRLTPTLSFRAGYGTMTTPLRYYEGVAGNIVSVDNFDYNAYRTGRLSLGDASYFGDKTRSASFGLGYSSPGSFFLDVAARRTFRPTRTFLPYSDYIFDEYGDVSVPSPTVRVESQLWDVLLTFGWRF